MASIVLNQNQINQINALTAQGSKDFYKAYEYIVSLNASGEISLSPDTLYWFKQAGEINSNDPMSPANVFIRAHTMIGAEHANKDIDMQKISDSIGQAVVGDLTAGRPIEVEQMWQKDISMATRDFGLPVGGWGGAFFYFDKKMSESDSRTLGEIIQSDPFQRATFVDAMSFAGAASLGRVLTAPQIVFDQDKMDAFGDAMAAGMNNIPFALKAQIIARTMERTYDYWTDGKYGSKSWEEVQRAFQSYFRGTFDDENLLLRLLDRFASAKKILSPIVLDLDGNGIATTDADGGAHFDHDGNGARERTGWVRGNDALLVLDRNGDGRIDTGRELFGNQTLLSNGELAANGYEALAELDRNNDGRIDQADDAYSSLRLWLDDGDGVLEAGELKTLAEAGVRSIATDFLATDILDEHGNRIRQVGTFERMDGSTGGSADVWFRVDPARGEAPAEVPVTPDVASLPDLWGFGNMPSLHQAVMKDTSGLMKQWLLEFVASDDPQGRRALFKAILYRWAGVDVRQAGAFETVYQQLPVLEAFLGDRFTQYGGTVYETNLPGNNASNYLNFVFQEFAEDLYARLVRQTHLSTFFDAVDYRFDATTNAYSTDLTGAIAVARGLYQQDPGALKDLAGVLMRLGADGEDILQQLRTFAIGSNDDFGEWLYDNLKLEGVGGFTDDWLRGNSSNDSLVGNAGNDLLDGGAGDDSLMGGLGDDTYVFGLGSGQDTVLDEGGTRDRIQFGPGILPSQVTLERRGFDTVIRIAGASDTLTVSSWGGGLEFRIEEFTFANGAVWNQAQIQALIPPPLQIGGAGNDVLAAFADEPGTLVGGAGDDTLLGFGKNDHMDGGDGADVLRGDLGNDTLLGGAGNDVLNAGEGEDQLDGGAGNDLLDAGAGNDSLLGGGGRDRLTGGEGDDTLSGGSGEDLLAGGAGDNLVLFDRNSGRDYLDQSLSTGHGRDVVLLGAGISASDVSLRRVDGHLVLRIAGSDAELVVPDFFAATGTGGRRNELSALKFADGTVWSGDVVRQRTQDLVLSRSTTPDGRTLVVAEGSAVLAADANDLAAQPGVYQFRLVGNAGDNVITGNAASNVFNGPMFEDGRAWLAWQRPGAGGLSAETRGGRDTLIGGAGDDVYYTTSINGEGNPYINYPNQLGEGNDTVVELAGEGHDTVVTTAYHETLADNVEDLVSFNEQDYYYTNTGRSISHTYTGNALDNVLDGSRVRGAVRLDGGLGADTMIGSGEADTTFVVDNVGDVVQAAQASGYRANDTVEASISYTLSAGIENLTMTGTAATRGAGNALNNVLDGSQNAAANTLVGGLGDDYYRVDASDVIVEKAGEGIDTVVIVSAGGESMFKLDLAASVERLVLDEAVGEIGVIGSDLDDNFTGNSKGNVMIGGAGNDEMDDGWIMDPMWGRKVVSGYDVMDGGAGDDRIRTHGDGDLITGGTGNDTISLNFDSWGWATIHFNRGDGADVIGETTTGSVQLEYGGDLDITNFVMARRGDDLVLTAGDAGDSMTFSQAFVDPGEYPFRTTISAVTFGDGFKLTGAELQTRFVSGTPTTVTEDADMIIGTAGADTLSGAGGDDRIAAGAGNDVLEGGDGQDLLSGGLGNDDLTGGLGYDTLAGGLGDDVYHVNAGDAFDEINDAGGTDTIVFGDGLNEAGMTVSTNWKNELVLGFNGTGVRIKDGRFEGAATDVEFVRFADGTVRDIAYLRSQIAVWGSDDADDLLGDASDERLRGLAGNDTLDGGGGADTLFGDQGDDTYIVDSNDDVVVEELNQGTDVVRTSVSYALSANVENIVLTGTASISATGNALNNKLDGNAGANRLDGGLGADAMKGGAGDDTYVVDNIGDAVTESSNQGTDKVLASIGYTLGGNVEQLELTGSSDINGTGNTLANVLVGNAGANVLTGGTGNDTMSGGLGNDTYVVDAVGDVVNENANEGIDLVQSAVNWTLGANVEHLTLTGNGTINGTGNGLDNVLTGNGSANKLDGGAGNDSLVGAAGADTLTGGTGNDTLDGGSGNDAMLGGAGDDLYIVDATTDAITENAGEGTDTVLTSVTLTLAANVENVTLATGTAALSATGNTGNNVMIGNAGANTLTGAAGNDTLQGGLGNDSLVGGAGADVYVFNKGDGTDTIQDSDSTANVLDQLTFGTGITRTGTTFKKVSNNLEITFTGTTTDKVVVKDWYLGAANQVERVVYADGTVMTNAQVNTAAGQPATAKTAMVRTSADREGDSTFQQLLFASGVRAAPVDQTVARQADALIEAMAAFSGSSGMATNASLPAYTGEFRDQFAVSAR